MRGTWPRVLLTAVLSLSLAAAQSHPPADDSADALRAGLQKFTALYDLIEHNFADKVDPDQAIYRGAIPTMLRTLDPHSNFFDPRAYQLLEKTRPAITTASACWWELPKAG